MTTTPGISAKDAARAETCSTTILAMSFRRLQNRGAAICP